MIVEIDGQSHLTQEGRERDRIRDDYLIEHGYKVLRMSGYEVIRENGNTRERIWSFVKAALDARAQ